jgi:ADP-ribosylglycohydrolase
VNLLESKVAGAIGGALIGDSMGSSVEFLHYKAVLRRYGQVRNLESSGGQLTDDSYLRLSIYSAIIEKHGRINAVDASRKWLTDVAPNKKFWVTELFTSAQLHMGVSPRTTGLHNIPANDAAMAIDPVGVVNCCNPVNAAMDARDVAGICQNGVELDAAMAVAASVASSFEEDVVVDDIIDSALKWCGSALSSKIAAALKITGASTNPVNAYKRLYEEIAVNDGSDTIVKLWRKGDQKIKGLRKNEVSLGISSTEALPVALGFIYMFKGQPIETITACVNYGRDSDTIAGIAGSIAGAYKGVSHLDSTLLRKVENANSLSIQSLARKVAKCAVAVAEEQAQRSQLVQRLMSSGAHKTF